MSIEFHVLGGAGRDNALLAYVHTGESVDRLLFDCGDGCLTPYPFSEIQRIDQLFFSHLHMDHVGGFDAFFRCTYNRTRKPNIIWGPPGTAEIMHHRFRGFLWNLHGDQQAPWLVCDVAPTQVACTRFELNEAFATGHNDGVLPFTGTLVETERYTVEALHMDHLTPSLAYVIRERPRLNIDPARLAESGIRPGPWLKLLKSPPPDQTHLEIDGVSYAIETLRASLLTEFPGDAIAYLTDFRLDDAAMARLIPFISGCRVVVCESAYRQADSELAALNYHMTTTQAATLAQRAHVGKLILIHLSERYRPAEWPDLLDEARTIFPETYFPRQWEILDR